MWDLEGDELEIFESPGILEVANLVLDESELEAMVFVDGDKDETIEVQLQIKKILLNRHLLYFGYEMLVL